jgi:hypothetical protein
MLKHYKLFIKVKYYIKIAVLIVTTYNLWFIPIQFAYKIKFTGVLLALELITMLVYTANLILLF